MTSIATDFIDFSLRQNVLQFGNFTLKSGRQSPYFFNAGLFFTGDQLRMLGQFYANTLRHHKIDFDVLFGPAYKGLPLATTTAVALSNMGSNIDVSFNRKEAKQHGEKGVLIGAPLKGKRVVMIDDVITAGTAYRESKTLIEAQGGKLVAVIVALDRQESSSIKKDALSQSTIDEIRQQDNVSVLSIASLQDIKDYLTVHNEIEHLEKITAYENKAS